MANRNTLHKSKLEAFKLFIESLGYKITEGKAAFEIARFKIPGKPMAIIFNGKSPVHYSVNEAAFPFVQKFIRSGKK